MEQVTKIDIVVPCYNVENVIGSCIESLLDQTIPLKEYHCIFINDYSSDNTQNVLQKYKSTKNITIINQEKNLGLAAARNAGIKKGCSELVALLDGDMTVEKDWLESLSKYFTKNIIAVMGDNIPPKNLSLNPVEKYYFGRLRGARQYDDNENIPLQYMLFGNAMIKREALEESGLFDEKINRYGGEDTDLSAKLWNIYPDSFVFSKKSNSTHHHRRNLDEFCKSMEIYGSQNLHTLIRRYPEHKSKFAADYISTLKGYFLFNALCRAFIRALSKIYPAQLIIRYLVADSVIKGARKTRKSY
jgi:glycosyltransferase involved in cell wall biosynthesis